MRRRGRVGRRRSSRSRTAASSRRDGHPVVLGEWLGAAGRADDPRLRPLRRAAAGRREPRGRRRRSSRACATAASTAAARPTTRARSSSRSRRPRRSSRRRRAAAQRALPDRGRGGDRQPEPAGASSTRTATSSPPTSSSRPTARCGAPSEPSIAIAAKGLLGARPRRSPGRRPTCTRAGTAAPCRTRTTRSPRIVASLHDAGRRGRRRRASTTTSSAARRRRSRRRSRACRSTRRPTGARSASPALHGEPGYSTLERLWTRPTLEVNELRGGGAFTVIPQRGARPHHVPARARPGSRRVFARDRRASARRRARRASSVDGRRQPGRGARLRDRRRPPGRRGCASVRSRTVYPDREPLLVRIGGTLPAAVALRADPRPEDAALLVLDRRRAAARAERVLPAQPPRRGMRAWAELWQLLSLEAP